MNLRPSHRTRKRQTLFAGSKIRQIRKEKGLTQSILASKVGIQQSDLCRMENGEYKVSLDALFKILGVFGLEIGEFFDDNKATSQGREQEILDMLAGLSPEALAEILEFIQLKLDLDVDSSTG